MPQISTVLGEISLRFFYMKINDLKGLQNIPNIKTVQYLAFENNQLSTIQPDAFAGLTNLKELYLGYSKLTTIQPNAFAGLKNLEWLALDNNQLTTIKQPKAFAGLTKLGRFELYDNQLDKKTKDALRKALQANINLYIMF